MKTKKQFQGCCSGPCTSLQLNIIIERNACDMPYIQARDDHYPVSSEISDLCEISDLLLFFSYFACQNKEIKSGN